MKQTITYDELEELQGAYELHYRGKYGIYDRYKLIYPSGDYKYFSVRYQIKNTLIENGFHLATDVR